MKNIHILPTDKETRLYLSNYGKELNLASHPKTLYSTGQHIYITSDEEIKDGDYFIALDGSNDIYKANKVWLDIIKENPNPSQKIILTTDQDLIKDGVQAIDDEFLEYYVSVPFGEIKEVEVDDLREISNEFIELDTMPYKIIIPKEEPKQIKCYCGHTTTCDCEPLEEPKQETIEEVAEKYVEINVAKNVAKLMYKEHFVEGAKWQQEKMYSEEDLIKFVSFVGRNYIKAKGFYYMKGDFEKSMKVSIHQIIEQFKKK